MTSPYTADALACFYLFCLLTAGAALLKAKRCRKEEDLPFREEMTLNGREERD
jgi:hypothetical protein